MTPSTRFHICTAGNHEQQQFGPTGLSGVTLESLAVAKLSARWRTWVCVFVCIFFIGDTLLSLIMRQHCCTGEQRSACRLGTPPLHLGPDCARGGSRQCASSPVGFRLRPPQSGAHCSQCIESVPQLCRIQEKLGGSLAKFCAWIVWIPS